MKVLIKTTLTRGGLGRVATGACAFSLPFDFGSLACDVALTEDGAFDVDETKCPCDVFGPNEVSDVS